MAGAEVVGGAGPTPGIKEEEISSQKNSSLSGWILSIAETFCFPFLAWASGLEGDFSD